MNKPPRDTRFFEEFARRNSMRPVCKYIEPDGEILIADSGEPFTNRDGLYVYRTGYAINRDGLEIGNYHDYPVGDFLIHSRAGALRVRVAEALASARDAMALSKEAGLYDADRKHAYSH